jgi:hypothetical protein
MIAHATGNASARRLGTGARRIVTTASWNVTTANRIVTSALQPRGPRIYPRRASYVAARQGEDRRRNSPWERVVPWDSRAKVKALTERAPPRREMSRAFGYIMMESR